jgi:hypothetical protein
MPRWRLTKYWDQQDVIIIGGGPSLKDLDWSLLSGENTIGCNTAFIHGPSICKVCIFGDYKWWETFKDQLSKYSDEGGSVFTNCPKLMTSPVKWLWTISRESHGLHESCIGWNGNTGAAAINLAILFGAKRIFLLGYDMKHIDGRSNWHNHIIDKKLVRPSVYPLFCHQFGWVKKDWKKKFPNIEIWNVTSDSGLSKDIIPWMSPEIFWASIKAKKIGFAEVS